MATDEKNEDSQSEELFSVPLNTIYDSSTLENSKELTAIAAKIKAGNSFNILVKTGDAKEFYTSSINGYKQDTGNFSLDPELNGGGFYLLPVLIPDRMQQSYQGAVLGPMGRNKVKVFGVSLEGTVLYNMFSTLTLTFTPSIDGESTKIVAVWRMLAGNGFASLTLSNGAVRK